MDNWRTLSLRDAGVVLIDCVHKTPLAVDTGYPYIAIPQMKNGRIDFSDARRISRDDFIEWTKKARPQVHDVVLSRRTNPGVTATFGESCEFALGQNLVLLRADGRFVCPEFLRWLTVSPAWWSQIEKYNNVGAVFDSLRCADVPSFELPIPPLREQGAIASILSALDDKIDINHRMNKTLEAMARAIFKDWFVDFGPTRAKMEGRGLALAPKIWSLFPKQLDREGTPEGWTKEQLLKHAHLLSGGTPKTAEPAYWGGPIQWASAKDVSQCGERFLLETERSITERGLEESSTRIIPSLSTVVVARGATTGRFCMFGSEIAMNQTCYALSTKTARPFWINCIFASLVDSIVHAAHGSVFDTITTKTIESAATIVPCDALLDEFENVVGPLFSKILKNTEVSRTLAATRDLLLPKLMSGELRLREAEKAIEAVA
jgi:type I restriction enzyme S subunit